ncbi:MAG: PilZ domain-containing protein [Cellvibrionaceae bacterium]
MSTSKEDDRRRFFRITDAIGVAYERIDTEKNDETVDDSNKIDIKSLLGHHDAAIDDILLDLREESPQAAKAVDAVNKKLDALLRFFELDSMASHENFQRVDEASISACGIAFPAGESIEVGVKLNLILYLQPSDEKVHAVGKVIGCQSNNDNHYLRVEFVDMNDADRECLIQHIVQRQGALLKTLREQMDDM